MSEMPKQKRKISYIEMKIIIRGNPIAQARPRFFIRQKTIGNQKLIGAQDHPKSKAWKETVRWQAIEQNVCLMEGPITLKLDFMMLRPKSLSNQVKYHVKRPDIDNLTKSILDALNGICWRDDSQIVMLRATKNYAPDPGVFIIIERL